MPRRLLVALHDVTPVHADRLERAERLFTTLGVSDVAYLFVPNFHGAAEAHMSETFVAWCRSARPFSVQWFLHGYFHCERLVAAGRTPRLSLGNRLAAAWLTSGEAEYLRLSGTALRASLSAGMRSFEHCLGSAPIGFVAPAWLFNADLLPALADRQFRFTESHLRLFHIPTGHERRCPVITWATRTALWRHGSIAAARMTGRLWRARSIVRIALHPSDFDHPSTIASIARTLDAFRSDRVVSPYEDSLFSLRSLPAV